MAKLALLGGSPCIAEEIPRYNTMGEEEAQAASDVVRSGVLSGFHGSWNERFYGGPRVREFESAWAETFQVRNAVTLNSWTSGLVASMGAAGVGPGDEVIVSPWTMSASATAILAWGGIPVFVDIREDTFNLDVEAVRRAITSRTRAIMVPDIFGQGADLDGLMALADEHGLLVMEDAAQAPYARDGGRFVGTLGHMGGFSLNYHKHIHTGEGGVFVTDDDDLAERVRLIRNHGEVIAQRRPELQLPNLVGYNLRMGEVEAAIGMCQLRKLPDLAARKSEVGAALSRGLGDLPGLHTPVVKPHCTHVYYIYGIRFDVDALGVDRAALLQALRAEGVPMILEGYQLIHLLPLYRQRIAFGPQGFPWRGRSGPDSQVTYAPGLCPVAERLHHRELLGLHTCALDLGPRECDLIIQAFQKIWENLDPLRTYSEKTAGHA